MSEYIVKCNEAVGISGKPLIVPDYIDTSKEIVRCRDCVHMLSIDLSDYYGNPESNLEVCKRVRGVHLNAEPDGYCAWAERREQ